MAALTAEQAQAVLAANFAPWVQDLGLRVESVGPDSALLRLPFAERLVRVGGVVCGQALMAAADTACVLALAASFGEFRPVATVAQNISLLRPVTNDDLLVEARVVRRGRTLAYCEAWLRAARDGREAAHASATFALPS
jgi:uncharacterized protein (TIGR00369 family)